MLAELSRYFLERSAAELGRDVLDVLITYYIFYRVALVLRGTRAIQVVVGLAAVSVLYAVAQRLRLETVLTLLDKVWASAIVVGVVIFQNDIRRGLMRVGARARFGTGPSLESRVIDQVVEAATTLARHRTGAIITFEQEANLDEFVGTNSGQVLDAAVNADLLVSLFIPEAMNKLHDGAVVIRELRVAKAGVFFPMPDTRVIDNSFGSRHRAAIGITEETDAVVVVVSEERGTISFCFNGNIVPNLDGPRLRAALDGVFSNTKAKKRRPSVVETGWRRLFRRSEVPPPPTVKPVRVPESRKPEEQPVSVREPVVSKKKHDTTLGDAPQPLRKKKKKAVQVDEKIDSQRGTLMNIGAGGELTRPTDLTRTAPAPAVEPIRPAPELPRTPSQPPPPMPMPLATESLKTPLRHLAFGELEPQSRRTGSAEAGADSSERPSGGTPQ
ncbi:MAG TPA: diadenylate cyclase CdaA [Polyangiaceae bacterium]|jgi:uncharacterized protein (TIGR00159 family)|nr:diadenylate cyclase CdaA [Polyangiaceae bacterium]